MAPGAAQTNPSRWRKRLRQAAVVCGAWFFLADLFAFYSYFGSRAAGRPIPLRQAVLLPLIHYGFWALLTPLVFWVARLLDRRLRHWPLRVLAHFLVVAGLAAVHTISWIPLRPMLMSAGMREAGNFRILYLQNLYPDLWVYWSIVAAWYLYRYYSESREARLRASEMEKELAQAQLQALKTQLQPHFLFNTLNSIAALMREDVNAADEMMGDLSALLRMSLETTAHTVPLRQEVAALEMYLGIQRARFSDRLAVAWEIAPDTLDASVPHLILQPLVENAVRHGIARQIAPGVVTIMAESNSGMLRLRVSDDGPGVADPTFFQEGIGLTNTRARLERLYGAAQKVTVETGAGRGFAVELELPLAYDASPEELPEMRA